MEETDVALSGPLEPLGEIRQRGGKRVIAFAVEGDVDVQTIRSNTFEIEWPPKGKRMQSFSEVDRAEWFDLPSANVKLLEGQRPLLDRLAELVNRPGTRPAPTLVRAWDGHGMAATQSHAFRYDGVAVERHAQLGGAIKLVPRVLPVIAYMFSPP